MKIQRLSKADPVERLSVSLKKSILDQLEAYKAYYEEHYKEPVQMSRLLEEILKQFIAGDKEFLKRLAEKQA